MPTTQQSAPESLSENESGRTRYIGDEERDLPCAADIAQMIQTLVDPDSDDDMRAEVIEQLANFGRCDVRSFRDAMVLTNNEGFVLNFRHAGSFQIAIV